MIRARIRKLRNQFKKLKIDGYVIPKNDEFFSEYSKIDRLKIISNFSGSAGYAIILKKKNYLFVDGRYSLQAKIESGKNFSIIDHHKIINCNLFKNLILGITERARAIPPSLGFRRFLYGLAWSSCFLFVNLVPSA